MTIDQATLYKAFSAINQNILSRGGFFVPPDPQFDYQAQLEGIQHRMGRIQDRATQQAFTNAQIRLANNMTLPPTIRFPNVNMRGGGGTSYVGGRFKPGGNLAGYSSDQIRNAATIANVGRKLGASRRDIVTALSAALVESRLRNVNYGDRDSLGLFQQRAPWGSRRARTTPRLSARMFYKGGRGGQQGLFGVHGRRHTPIGAVAQDVQVSAYPGRYAQEVDTARRILQYLSRGRPHRAPRGGRTSPGPQR